LSHRLLSNYDDLIYRILYPIMYYICLWAKASSLNIFIHLFEFNNPGWNQTRADDARHYFLLTSATPRTAIRPPTTIEINIGSSNNVAENKTPNAGTKLVKIAVRDGPTV